MAKKKPSRRSNTSSTRGTVSGPSRPSGAIRDAAAAKAAATELVAEAFPFNAAKPSEFEQGGAEAATGSKRRAAASERRRQHAVRAQHEREDRAGRRHPGPIPGRIRSTACASIRRAAR